METSEATLDMSLLHAVADVLSSDPESKNPSVPWQPWYPQMEGVAKCQATMYAAGVGAASKLTNVAKSDSRIQDIKTLLQWACNPANKLQVQAFLDGYQGYLSRRLLCMNKCSVK
jgi:hypothetical protein